MATSANNYTDPTPEQRPTGDLEYLFRQRLGEAEVAPRLQLWEQLDHDLLVQQNEAYRRRLVVYRWVAAACVLLIVGFGGWAGLHQFAGSTATTPELAAQSRKEQPGATPQPTPAGTSYATADAADAAAAGNGAAAARLSAVAGLSAEQGATGAAAALALLSETEQVGRGGATSRLGSGEGLSVGSQGFAPAAYFPAATASLAGATANESRASELLTQLMGRSVRPGRGLWYRRPDTLKPALQAAPPALAAFAPLPEEEDKPENRSKRWRFGGSHALTSFNPNINFSQVGAGTASYADLLASAGPYDFSNNVNSSSGANALAYEANAAEYRQHLQPGVGQRATLTAAVAPNKHWVLTTGVEVAEYRASSQVSMPATTASAAAFAGRVASAPQYGQANFALLAPPANYQSPRSTSYRYRTVGVPVSARYGSNKTGVSLYAKVGAAVDLLLGSRVEVADVAAATREYSLGTQDSPYRKVLAVVRGGGGVQYRPTGATWALLVGPTAEAGLTTLNSNPAQSVLRRSRPYAVGLEASVEFGGGQAAAVPVSH